MVRTVALHLLVGLIVVAPLSAVGESSDLTPAQRQRFDRLARELIAPCCWREPIDSHQSPAAEAMRAELELQIRQQRSDEEIIDALVAEHGEGILPVPRGGKADALFWTPVIATGIGLIAVAGVIVALLRRKPPQDHPDLGEIPQVEVRDEDLEW